MPRYVIIGIIQFSCKAAVHFCFTVLYFKYYVRQCFQVAGPSLPEEEAEEHEKIRSLKRPYPSVDQTIKAVREKMKKVRQKLVQISNLI